MIKKYTLLDVVDNSGVSVVKCIHHYFGSNKSTSKIGEFIKVSVRKRHYDEIWVKSKMVTILRKGKRVKSYIIRTRFKKSKIDNTEMYYTHNSNILLKKRLTSRGKYAFGCFSYNHGRKKILGSFPGII